MKIDVRLSAALAFCFSLFSNLPAEADECSRERSFSGEASFYANQFHGRRTASGTRLNNNGYTCAHRYLPFGTKVLVENPDNGTQCVVTVTDRGPFCKNRVIDLTRAAARKLKISGIGRVVCRTGSVASRLSKSTLRTVASGVSKKRIISTRHE